MKQALAFILFIFFSSCGGAGSPAKERSLSTLMSDEYLHLLNQHRQELGLRPLLHAAEIEGVATQHSLKMSSGLTPFGHLGMSERCRKIKTLLGGGNLCGEIVARGQKTVEEVFRAWLNSPAHRRNLEEARYTHTGLGFTQAENGEIFWTELFLEL